MTGFAMPHAVVRTTLKLGLILGVMLAAAQPAAAAPPKSGPPVAPDAPLTPKVQSLLGALTLDEKISLIHGATDPASLGQAGYLPGVPRLGIPVRRDADALGINVYKDATAIPTRLGIAASFDRNAATALGQLEGREGRALGVDLMYGPQVDIARTPDWARNFSTLGEDPYLSSQLAVPEVQGIQSQGLMSEIKHFAVYNGQAAGPVAFGFGSVTSVIDDQTLHELYLPPYENAVVKGQPSSVMCSYASFQVTPEQSSPTFACDNALTLQTILRGQWGFTGFVLSDYGATSTTQALINGLDQQYPDASPGFSGTWFSPAVLGPYVDPTSPTYDPAYASALNTAVAEVLYEYERFGLLACASASGPIAGCHLPSRPTFNEAAGARTSEALAEEAAVLLQNNGNLLPLDKSDLQHGVAVVGPTADLLPASPGGERSRGFGDQNMISPLDALEQEAPNASISYAPGIDRVGIVVPAASVPGGWARSQDGVAAGTDATLNFNSSNPLTPGVNYTWTGTVNVPTTDTYALWLQRSPGVYDSAGSLDPTGGRGGSNSGAVSLSVDGSALPTATPSTIIANTYPGGPTINGQYQGLQNNGAYVPLTAGPHTLTIGFNVAAAAAAPVYFRLTWSPVQASINAAVAAAASAKTAVVLVDDANPTAPAGAVNSLGAYEDQLVSAVAAVNPRTVVVLNTGDPVLMPWLGQVKSLLEMWYPGEDGGKATADILLGRADPGGKLPITFPASAAQTPFAGHPERILGVAGQTTWSEGLQVGYRWYDAQGIQPLFPFGYGLSYTKFSLSDLHVSKARDGGFDVSVHVRNVGRDEGADVVQVYVGPSANVPSNIQQVQKKLVQFGRVELRPGQSQTLKLHVQAQDLSYWSTAGQSWVLGTGLRQVYVGDSSRNLSLSRSIFVH
jgi:beta-glucosidase